MTPSLAKRETPERTFERLYRLHRSDVYYFVLRDLRDPDDAEDVTQAAFLNAYRALQRGSHPEKPRAWLLTIARNVARRRFRARASRPREVELDPDALVAPESDAPSAAEIRTALMRMRPNQRAVIVLREIGGLSYAEIAETLGLSVSAVETLIFRSRRALREELGAAEEQAAVRVGGLVLWPLPAALSEVATSFAAWFGRRAVTAKVAGALGATVIGSGVALETGAVSFPGAPDQTPASVIVGPDAKASPGRPAEAAAEQERKPKRERGANTSMEGRKPAAGGSAMAASALPEVGLPPVLPGLATVPAVELPEIEVPDVAVPEVDVPEIDVPQVSVPPVAAPELPVLPETELPPLPGAG